MQPAPRPVIKMSEQVQAALPPSYPCGPPGQAETILSQSIALRKFACPITFQLPDCGTRVVSMGRRVRHSAVHPAPAAGSLPHQGYRWQRQPERE